MTVRDRADAELLDDVPERPGVVPHPAITSHDRDNLRRFAEQLGRCKMHRIERADRLDGKGAADAGEHRSVNVENEAPPLEGSQGSNGRLFFCCGQPKGRARSDDRPAGLCESQGRRHVLCPGRRRLHGRRVVLQQCRNERARLHVPNARPGSPRSAGARGCFPTRAALRGATLRHDRCRSVQRRCPAAAGCPASPRTGHQPPPGGGERLPQ